MRDSFVDNLVECVYKMFVMNYAWECCSLGYEHDYYSEMYGVLNMWYFQMICVMWLDTIEMGDLSYERPKWA